MVTLNKWNNFEVDFIQRSFYAFSYLDKDGTYIGEAFMIYFIQ